MLGEELINPAVVAPVRPAVTDAPHWRALPEARWRAQVTETLSPMQVAEMVADCFPGAVIDKLPNPRVEPDGGYYNVVHTKLEELGLEPHLLSEELIGSLAGIVKRYAHRVRPELLRPAYDWHQAA